MAVPGDLVGRALPLIVAVASVLLSARLVSSVFFKRRTPKSDHSSVPAVQSTPTAAEPSSRSGSEYEVFLSFRGPDTRTGFTDHLYHGLKAAGVHVFRDDEELRVGEKIWPEIVRGIEQSRICIPVFSKGYASSKWCLNEAALMMEQHRKTRNHLILPIFYDVTPDEVKHQTGSYAKAFSQHQKDCGKEQVQLWRHALAEIKALKGWNLKNTANGHQGPLITQVVTKVLSELKKAHLLLTDKLIGMDEHVENLKGLLEVEASDTRIVGFWGMGGIGKTTLAKAIYNQLANDFDRCSFLSDIREASKAPNGLKELQAQLVADLSRWERPNFASIDEGVKEIRRKFRDLRVLILLDDIDQKDQLEALAAEVNCYGPGSRILITTRDKDALNVPEGVFTYEVKEMNDDQALQLFCKHSFRKDHPEPELHSLSVDIVRTAGGLPLAIEVIGSLLSGKSKPTWESTLEKLKSIPSKKVRLKLKISYDALEHNEQQVFLDIACFFIGEDKRIAAHMWEACEFYPEHAIDVLVAMSLIKIRDDDKLSMHDQLRDLGREIVRQENYNVPERRSRLWRERDITDVLETSEGTKYVQAISLQGELGATRYACQGQNLKKVSKLRFLRLDRADLTGNFQILLSELRWLIWQNSSFSYTTELHLPNLVILDLSGSNVRDEWNFWHSNEKCGELKILKLSRCNELTTTPHFSMFPNLERLILEDCKKLSVVDASIERLKALSFLSLKGCSTIMNLPHQLGSLKALKELVLDGTCIKELPVFNSLMELEILSVKDCKLLTCLPDSLGSLTSLTELVLDRCGIFGLPRSISSLRKLRILSAESCEYLMELPNFMGQLESLTKLNLSLTRIATLPDSIKNLSSLEVLEIERTALSCLPSALGKLHKLKVIEANECTDLSGEIPIELGEASVLEKLSLNDTKISSIPEAISRVSHLQSLDLRCCKMLESLPELPVSLVHLMVTCKSEVPIPNLCHLINLKLLGFEECEKFVVVPRDIGKLSKLETLLFSKEQFTYLPDELGDLPRLKSLHIESCRALEYLPTLPSSLCYLFVGGCIAFRRLPKNLSNLRNLLSLNLSQCHELPGIPELGDLVSLMSLELNNCPKIVELFGLERLESLRSLSINLCENLIRLPDLSKLKRLSTINIGNCKNLVEVQGLDSLYALTSLELIKCAAMKVLPELSSLKLLKKLHVEGCNELQELKGFDELALEELTISRCVATEKLSNLSKLTSLLSLSVSGCEVLIECKLGELESLEELSISECEMLKRLPNLSKLKRLRELNICSCKDLQELEGLDKLEALKRLHISECGSIENLPNISSLKLLKVLKIVKCWKLRGLEGLGGLERLKLLHISGSESIEKLQDLCKLKMLTFLIVEACEKLQELDGLDGLEELKILRVTNCASIKTLPDRSKLKRLQKQYFSGSKDFKEIPGFEDMELLEESLA